MLPYWNSDLDLEVASWFPFGVDYQPISMNSPLSPRLRRVAAFCLDRGSEFFFMSSLGTGPIGSLMRDNFYRVKPQGIFSLGFMMILGYSPRMERLIGAGFGGSEDLSAGVAFCSLWNRGVLMENIKVIVLVSEGIFFDEEKFLTDFEGMLAGQDGDPGLAFFAEQFGYRRFCMAYETDDPLQLRISRLLYEMEFAETRQMVGPSPEVSFPPFFGLVPAE